MIKFVCDVNSCQYLGLVAEYLIINLVHLTRGNGLQKLLMELRLRGVCFFYKKNDCLLHFVKLWKIYKGHVYVYFLTSDVPHCGNIFFLCQLMNVNSGMGA
jgi:hypothetical protein